MNFVEQQLKKEKEKLTEELDSAKRKLVLCTTECSALKTEIKRLEFNIKEINKFAKLNDLEF